MRADGTFEPGDYERHWHLYPSDWVRGSAGRIDIERAGVYRIHEDGTIEDWGPVTRDDWCPYCPVPAAVAP